jgi:hypothetical protein
MLPDFLELKKELSNLREGNLRSNFRDPALQKIATFQIHEGDRFTLLREDGSKETKKLRKVRKKITIKLKDVQNRGEKAIVDVFADAMQEIEEATKTLLENTLKADTEAYGTAFDAGGRRFTAELYLEALEDVMFTFDAQGNWEPGEIWQRHPNPIMAQQIKKELDRFNTEPALKKKLDALIKRKRKEWDVREANRKLVD